MRVRSERTRRLEPTRLQAYLLPLFILFAAVCGGGAPVWAQGLILVFIGAWLLLRPPAETESRTLEGLCWLAALLGLLSFLPQVFSMPGWRLGLEEAGIDTGPLVSPQPLVSKDAALALFAGGAWLVLLLGWRVNQGDRIRLLWLFSAGSAMAGMVVAGATFLQVSNPLAPGEALFSLFPDRNQTALFLCLGALCAFGLAMQALRRGAAGGLLGFIFCLLSFLGVLFCVSRLGIGLFIAGCGLWFLLRVKMAKAPVFFKLAVPLIIVVLALIVANTQDALSGLAILPNEQKPQEERVEGWQMMVAEDILLLASAHPLAGVGGGNFADVFPQYQVASAGLGAVGEPGSDWLWLLADFGAAGVILALILTGFALKRVLPVGQEPSSPYRAIAGVAFAAFLVHTIFDVSAHAWGTFLAATFLWRLAIAPSGPGSPKGPRQRHLLPRLVYRVMGILILVGGGLWLLSSARLADVHARSLVAAQLEAAAAAEESGFPEAVELAVEQGLLTAPLSQPLYLLRAQNRLLQSRRESAAVEDFRRAALLAPSSPLAHYLEGQGWLQIEPEMAFTAWSRMFEQALPGAERFFPTMVEQGIRVPAFRPFLSRLSQNDARFRYHYLMAQSPGVFRNELLQEIEADALMEKFSFAEKEMLLDRWASSADSLNLVPKLDAAQDALSPFWWYYQAKSLASEGDFEAAVERLILHLEPAVIPLFPTFYERSLEEVERASSALPGDIDRGSTLLEKQLDAGDLIAAQKTVERLVDIPNAPAYIFYWEGELARLDGDYQNAWSSFDQYMQLLVAKYLN